MIVKYCKTQNQVTNIFTKTLKFDLFINSRKKKKLGIGKV